MTSGPGGQDPQQGWQPPQQGGQPPQQGWQAPPPYPGGYMPAPSAPGAPTGPPPARPDSVRFGIGAFIANLLLGLVASVVTFASLDSIIDDQLAATGVDLSEDAIRTVLVVGAVITLLVVALEALFIWFAWQGRNWARIVLFVLGALAVLGGLSALTQPTTGFLSALSVCQMLLALVGVVLLARRPSSEWYRAMTARRQAGLR